MINELYLSGINFESFVDGDGVRCTLFISGCNHNCKGCHNPESHNFKYGKLVTDDIIREINLNIAKRPFLSGITLSGGDPVYSAEAVCELLTKLNIPKNNIWLYTGFTKKELDDSTNYHIKELINKVNVIVDGPYIEELRNITLDFVGSSNQHVLRLR